MSGDLAMLLFAAAVVALGAAWALLLLGCVRAAAGRSPAAAG